MKTLVYFKPIEIDIDEQTYEEYKDGDEIAKREVLLEINDVLKNKMPNISHLQYGYREICICGCDRKYHHNDGKCGHMLDDEWNDNAKCCECTKFKAREIL